MNRLSSFLLAAALLTASNVQAQNEDDNFIFTHLGAGLSIGTDGVGIEVATPVTPYVGLRAGVSFIPKITVNINDIDYERKNKEGEASVEAALKKIDGKFLVDAYPFGNKFSFHVTAGLFFGTSELVTASFKEDSNAPIDGGIVKNINGAEWMMTPVDHRIDFRLRTNAVKPYVGIGFGRMVPKPNKRIGVSCDIGVQFHGTPKFEGLFSANTATGMKQQWSEIESKDFDFGEDFTEDIDDALDIIHKVKVWPVLNVRLTGRIF